MMGDGAWKNVYLWRVEGVLYANHVSLSLDAARTSAAIIALQRSFAARVSALMILSRGVLHFPRNVGKSGCISIAQVLAGTLERDVHACKRPV